MKNRINNRKKKKLKKKHQNSTEQTISLKIYLLMIKAKFDLNYLLRLINQIRLKVNLYKNKIMSIINQNNSTMKI